MSDDNSPNYWTLPTDAEIDSWASEEICDWLSDILKPKGQQPFGTIELVWTNNSDPDSRIVDWKRTDAYVDGLTGSDLILKAAMKLLVSEMRAAGHVDGGPP